MSRPFLHRQSRSGDRAEPVVEVVVDRDPLERRDRQRDHGRPVGRSIRTNDDIHGFAMRESGGQ